MSFTPSLQVKGFWSEHTSLVVHRGSKCRLFRSVWDLRASWHLDYTWRWWWWWFCHFKMSPHLLQLHRRTLPHCSAVKLQKRKSIINVMKLQDVITSERNGWESHFKGVVFCWFLSAITMTSLRLLWPRYINQFSVLFFALSSFVQRSITSLFNSIHRESVHFRREFPHQVFFLVSHKE